MSSYVDGMGTIPARALWSSTDLEQCPLVSVEDPLTRSLDSDCFGTWIWRKLGLWFCDHTPFT